MTNKTLSGQESKNKLFEGIKIVNDAVSSTLGPAGRNVLLENEDGTIRVTKDGVSVANSIKKLSDPIANIGVQLMKQVANKSADKAGDGTTTSTLLAAVMVEEGMKRIQQGSNAIEVKRGIDKAVKIVIDTLKKISVVISSEEQMKQVATISANNDIHIGDLIIKALNNVGNDGVVTIEESKTVDTYLEEVQGMMLNKGFIAPYFVTDNTTMRAILEKPLILLYDGIISAAKDMMPFWEYAARQQKALLVISQDFNGEAVATFLMNKARGILKGAAVKAPDFGDRRGHILQDIAILTGGQVLSEKLGHKLSNFTKTPSEIPNYLGNARLVSISKDDTTIIDGMGDQEKIENRVHELRAQIDNATSNFEIEKLQERLGKLVGGVSIIHVGALTEVELKEKKDRAEDALHATKAAIEEGILPGGGIALTICTDALYNGRNDADGDEKLGFDIVEKAIFAPFKKILSNAGIDDPYRILSTIENKRDYDFDQHKDWIGYNVKSGEYEDFLETGVLDPTKVTRSAIENAASVAGTILTTESIVYLDRSDKDDEGKFDGMDFPM